MDVVGWGLFWVGPLCQSGMRVVPTRTLIHLVAQKDKWILCPVTLTASNGSNIKNILEESVWSFLNLLPFVEP